MEISIIETLKAIKDKDIDRAYKCLSWYKDQYDDLYFACFDLIKDLEALALNKKDK